MYSGCHSRPFSVYLISAAVQGLFSSVFFAFLKRCWLKTFVIQLAFVGENAIESYYSSPTQWSNNRVSDVAYRSGSDDQRPVITWIQHTVDNGFHLCLISAARQYRKEPVLITFAISAMKYDVSRRTSVDSAKPYLLKIQHCQPWAPSLRQSLSEEPLNKVVALGLFQIGQHRSLAGNPFYRDATVQNLYAIAKETFEDQANKKQTEAIEDLLYVCDESKKKLEEAVAHLDSSEVPEATKASIKSCIEGALLISSSYRAKHDDNIKLPFREE